MAILKQSTAYNRPFLMVESADHITGLTGATVTVTISKNGASFGSPSGTVTEIGNGWYYIALAQADTNTLGPLAIHATATSGDPMDDWDQVQSQIFSDLQLNANGRALIASNLQQNTAVPFFPFLMTNSATGAPQTGLTVSAQRDIGAGFAPCANAVSEIGNGIYTIALAASDTNAAVVMLRFTATGANDQDIQLVTSP